MSAIRITDGASAEDCREAIGHLCTAAKRLPHIVGTPECPTPWDLRHRAIDELLDLIELDDQFRNPVA